MGENPKSVFIVGSLGLTNLEKLKILSKREIEKKLRIKLKEKNIIVTFHPEIDKKKTINLINYLFKILGNYNDINIFISSPNADSFSGIIRKKI